MLVQFILDVPLQVGGYLLGEQLDQDCSLLLLDDEGPSLDLLFLLDFLLGPVGSLL